MPEVMLDGAGVLTVVGQFEAGRVAEHFQRLYAKQSLHAGLVIIIPSVSRAQQRRLFRGALDELAALGGLINRVLEVDIDGDDVTFTLYDLPNNLR